MGKNELDNLQMSVNKNYLVHLFNMRNIIYGENLDYFRNLTDEKLKKWLDEIYEIVIENYRKHVFSSSNKQFLFKVLEIYRDRFRDIDNLNRINEIISILNLSSEENYLKLVNHEFEKRFLAIIPFRCKVQIKSVNFRILEQMVIDSICNDFYFFKTLTEGSKQYFLEENVSDGWALTSLSSLIEVHPEVLDKSDVERILDLLEYNLLKSKDESSFIGNIYDNSKECLKRIKKFKLDRL